MVHPSGPASRAHRVTVRKRWAKEWGYLRAGLRRVAQLGSDEEDDEASVDVDSPATKPWSPTKAIRNQEASVIGAALASPSREITTYK